MGQKPSKQSTINNPNTTTLNIYQKHSIFNKQKPTEIINLQESITKKLYKPNTQITPQNPYDFFLGIDMHQKTYGIKGDIENGCVKIYHLINMAENQGINGGTLLFEGQMKNGLRQGYGIEYCYQIENTQIPPKVKNNSTLNGQKQTNQQRINHPNNQKKTSTLSEYYNGYFAQNLYNGWGICPYERYEGQWKNGHKSGFGKMMSQSSTSQVLYQGQWRDNLPNGVGFGNISNLEIIQEFLKQSYTTLVPEQSQQKQFQLNNNNNNSSIHPAASSIKGQYIGQWKDGLRTGCGKSISLKQHQPVLEIYQGDFHNNLYEGQGHLIEKPAGVNQQKINFSYKGLFSHGTFVQGKFVDIYGVEKEVTIKNGKA